MDTVSDKELKRLLKKAHDRRSGLIKLNRLWANPDLRPSFYEQVHGFWTRELGETRDSVILVPEGVKSSYGVLPIASKIAFDLGCYLAIWDELGDILTARPRMVPDESDLPRQQGCIVFQDVVGEGTVLEKIAEHVLSLEWKVTYYVGVVQVTDYMQDLKDRFHVCRRMGFLADDFRFVAMVKQSRAQE